MRVRLTEAVGTPRELLAIPGLARDLRLAIRRNVRHPGVPPIGLPGTGIGQSRTVARQRRARINAVNNGRAPGHRPRPWREVGRW